MSMCLCLCLCVCPLVQEKGLIKHSSSGAKSLPCDVTFHILHFTNVYKSLKHIVIVGAKFSSSMKLTESFKNICQQL